MKFKIRFARSADAGALSHTIKHVAAGGEYLLQMEDECPTVSQIENQISEGRKSQNFLTIVCIRNEDVLGYLRFTRGVYRKTKGLVQISTGVVPLARGMGIGKRMTNYLIGISPKIRIHRIQMLVDPENYVSIEMHKSIGFEVEGNLKRYAWDGQRFYDRMVMSRLIQ